MPAGTDFSDAFDGEAAAPTGDTAAFPDAPADDGAAPFDDAAPFDGAAPDEAEVFAPTGGDAGGDVGGFVAPSGDEVTRVGDDAGAGAAAGAGGGDMFSGMESGGGGAAAVAAAPAPVAAAAPEPPAALAKWRVEWEASLDAKKAASAEKQRERAAAAQAALVTWRAEHAKNKETKASANREDQSALLAEMESLTKGDNPWERVVSLVNFGGDRGRASSDFATDESDAKKKKKENAGKDTGRIKDVLIQLKNHPLPVEM